MVLGEGIVGLGARPENLKRRSPNWGIGAIAFNTVHETTNVTYTFISMYLLDWIVSLLEWLQTWIPPGIFPYVMVIVSIGSVLFFTFLPSIAVYSLQFITNLRQTQLQPRRRKLSPMDELEIDLLRLCHGDKDLARRLYKSTKERYPGKDKKWYLDKTIGDLHRDRGVKAPRYISQPAQPTSKPQQQTNSTLKTDGVLEGKIIRLLNGDREQAIRLLKNVKAKNPGQSYEWYLQKVIWDLERDRNI